MGNLRNWVLGAQEGACLNPGVRVHTGWQSQQDSGSPWGGAAVGGRVLRAVLRVGPAGLLWAVSAGGCLLT